MTKIETAKQKILEAAEAGRISLADLTDGDMFDDVGEWLDSAADCDIVDTVETHGLGQDDGPDILEINRRQTERLAAWAGIRPSRRR